MPNRPTDRSLWQRLLLPNFLRRIDRRLVQSYPLIWRTKIHYATWYGLVVANLAYLALGCLWPISIWGVPTQGAIRGSTMMMRTIAAIGLLYWVYVQSRIKMGERGWRDYLLTLFLYTLCVLSIGGVSVTFVAPLTWRISRVAADLNGDGRASLLASQEFWQGNGDYYVEFVQQLHWNVVRAFVAASLILLGLLFTKRLRPYLTRQFTLPRPRWSIRSRTPVFSRAEAWLRIRRPVLWSTRIHTFNAYIIFWIGAVIVGCVSLNVIFPTESFDSVWTGAWTGVTYFWLPLWLLAALCWQQEQKTLPLHATTIPQNLLVVVGYLFAGAIYPVVAITFAEFEDPRWQATLATFLILFGSFAVFLSKYFSKRYLISASISLVIILQLMLVVHYQSHVTGDWPGRYYIHLVPVIVLPAAIALLTAATNLRWLVSVLIALYFLYFATITPLLASYDLLPPHLAAATLMLFIALSIPVIHALVRHRYWPRADR